MAFPFLKTAGLVPKLNLFGHERIDGSLALPIVWANNGDTSAPLLIGDEHEPHISRRRRDGFYFCDVGVHLFIAHTGPCIDAPLDHEVAMVEEILAETGRRFLLLIGEHWQVEHGHDPSHTIRAFLCDQSLGVQKGVALFSA